MAKKEEKEIERWVTVNGARVPIFKDGSIGGPKALRDKVQKKINNDSANKTAHSIPKHYSESMLKDEEFRKDALKEMRRYEENWKGMSAKDRKNIGTLKEVRERIKEIENYEKANNTKEKQIKQNKAATNNSTKQGMKNIMNSKDGTTIQVEKFSAITGKSTGEMVEYTLHNGRWSSSGHGSFDNNSDGFSKLNSKNGIVPKIQVKQTDASKKVPEKITGKNVKWLDYNIKQQGLGMEGADMADIERDAKFMNGEKVSLYDKDGNEYRGTFNVYNDGGMEVVDIKKEWYNRKPTDTHSTGVKDDDTKEKQIARNKAEADERNGNTETYKKEYKDPDAYFSAVSVAERALEEKAMSKLKPLPYFSKEARQRDKDIESGKYRVRIYDASKLSLSDLRTVAQSLGKKTEGKSKAELVAMIEEIFKKG